MPHMPRRYASTLGVSPELSTVPRRPRSVESRPPVPYHGSSEGEGPLSDYHKPPQQRQMERLSIQRFEVDPDRVYQQLFGMEAEVDEHTRELVPARSKPFPGAKSG